MNRGPLQFFKLKSFYLSGGKDGIINPMVHNMAPAYDNAQYEYVWISTSRIRGLYMYMISFVKTD